MSLGPMIGASRKPFEDGVNIDDPGTAQTGERPVILLDRDTTFTQLSVADNHDRAHIPPRTVAISRTFPRSSPLTSGAALLFESTVYNTPLNHSTFSFLLGLSLSS